MVKRRQTSGFQAGEDGDTWFKGIAFVSAASIRDGRGDAESRSSPGTRLLGVRRISEGEDTEQWRLIRALQGAFSRMLKGARFEPKLFCFATMLILLVGPKGSGKSHVGRLLASRLGVHFFHVEPHWMRYYAACAAAGQPARIAEGIERVHPAIANALAAHEHVCIETTGASEEILEGLLLLGERFGLFLVGLFLVRVHAPLSLCLDRIATRDQTSQIPMGEDDIRKVYALSVAVDLPFDIVLENVDLTEEQILRPFIAVGFGEA